MSAVFSRRALLAGLGGMVLGTIGRAGLARTPSNCPAPKPVCVPNDAALVYQVTVTYPGAGYTVPPEVRFDPPCAAAPGTPGGSGQAK
jgi:hypothetical protein